MEERAKLTKEFQLMDLSNVELSCINSNITFLTEQGYSRQDIRQVIFILPHSPANVKAKIEMVKRQMEPLSNPQTELNVAMALILSDKRR